MSSTAAPFPPRERCGMPFHTHRAGGRSGELSRELPRPRSATRFKSGPARIRAASDCRVAHATASRIEGLELALSAQFHRRWREAA
jgi:hypothetical protein